MNSDNRIIPLITTLSRYSVKINKALKTNFNQLVGEDRNIQIISAFKRNKNQKDLLVQSKLKPPNCKTNPPLNPKIARNCKTGEAYIHP